MMPCPLSKRRMTKWSRNSPWGRQPSDLYGRRPVERSPRRTTGKWLHHYKRNASPKYETPALLPGFLLNDTCLLVAPFETFNHGRKCPLAKPDWRLSFRDSKGALARPTAASLDADSRDSDLLEQVRHRDC